MSLDRLHQRPHHYRPPRWPRRRRTANPSRSSRPLNLWQYEMRRQKGDVAFVSKPHRGIFCGLALDLPPASGEGITSHNSRWGIGAERSGADRPRRRPPLAERGEIRRPCAPPQLCRCHSQQVACQAAVVLVFRAKPRVMFIRYSCRPPGGSVCKGDIGGTPPVRVEAPGVLAWIVPRFPHEP